MFEQKTLTAPARMVGDTNNNCQSTKSSTYKTETSEYKEDLLVGNGAYGTVYKGNIQLNNLLISE